MTARKGIFELRVVGHLNLDHEMEVPELPGADRTVPVLTRATFLGGTACNLARWTAKFGLRTALSAFVGEDLPAEFRAQLRKEGVDLDGVYTRKGAYTPACWIYRDGSGHQLTVIDQGAMHTTAKERLPDLAGVEWIHLTTGDPAYQLAAARAAHRRHVPISFDPAQEIHYRWKEAQVREMLGHTSLLFANRHEAERLAKFAGVRTPERLTEIVPVAVVTDGARGAKAYTRRGTISQAAVRVRTPKAVTGAGDAFRGGFYAGWLRGETLENSVLRGVRTARLVVANPRERYLPPLSR